MEESVNIIFDGVQTGFEAHLIMKLII